MPKRVEVNETLRGRMNFKGRLLQKQTNSATKLQKKTMRIYDQKKTSAKIVQNLIWEGLGLHLGGVWDGLGSLLGTFGRFWVAFLVF